MLSRKTPVSLALVALFGAVQPSAAQTSPVTPTETAEPTRLGELTVSATRTERATDAVPNTVSVYGRQRLQDREARDLKDLLTHEVDIAVRAVAPRFTAAGASTGRAGNEGINIRGLEGNQVLMMVDGIRLPRSFSFGAFASGRADFVDTELLASAEVLRGPASAQFGSDGLGGALSLRTLSPSDLLVKGKSRAGFVNVGALTGDQSRRVSGAFAASAGAWEGLLMGVMRRGHETRNQGQNTAPNSLRTAPDPADIDSHALLGKLGYRLNAHQRLQVALEARRRTADIDALSARAVTVNASTPTAVVSLRGHDTLRRERLSLEHRYEDLNADWLQALNTTVYAQSSETRQHALEDRHIAADRVRDGRYQEALIGLSSMGQTQLAGQRLSYGLDLSRTRIKGLRDGTVPPAGESFPNKPFPDTDFTQVGAFVQDEIEWGQISLIPALRFEHFKLQPKAAGYSAAVVSLSDQAVTPRLGVIWRASADLQPYAQWSQGFRAPTPDQVNNGFANPLHGYRSIGNPNLKPEHADSLELGLRGQVSGVLRWQLTAYDNRYRDFISQEVVGGAGTPSNPTVFQHINLSSARIRGAEARLMWQPLAGLSVSAALAQSRGHSERRGVRTPLPTVLPTRASLGLRWESGDWDVQAAWLHSAAKRASHSSIAADFLPPAHDVIDLGASYRFAPGWRVATYLSNVTDSKYWRWSDVRGIAANSPVLDAFTAPGRHWQVSLRADF